MRIVPEPSGANNGMVLSAADSGIRHMAARRVSFGLACRRRVSVCSVPGRAFRCRYVDVPDGPGRRLE